MRVTFLRIITATSTFLSEKVASALVGLFRYLVGFQKNWNPIWSSYSHSKLSPGNRKKAQEYHPEVGFLHFPEAPNLLYSLSFSLVWGGVQLPWNFYQNLIEFLWEFNRFGKLPFLRDLQVFSIRNGYSHSKSGPKSHSSTLFLQNQRIITFSALKRKSIYNFSQWSAPDPQLLPPL